LKNSIRSLNVFAKITGYPVQLACFRTKVTYKDKSIQSRRIKGPAIIVSNHTSVYDYAVMIFVFLSSTLRVPIAEVMFRKQPLAGFLKAMGGIQIDRDTHSLSSLSECEDVLLAGDVLLIFPEGRIPRKDETPPLEFKHGAAALSLATGAQVIPVYTNGSYFRKERARVAVGTPVDVSAFCDPELSDTQNLAAVSAALREAVIELAPLTETPEKQNKKEKVS